MVTFIEVAAFILLGWMARHNLKRAKRLLCYAGLHSRRWYRYTERNLDEEKLEFTHGKVCCCRRCDKEFAKVSIGRTAYGKEGDEE